MNIFSIIKNWVFKNNSASRSMMVESAHSQLGRVLKGNENTIDFGLSERLQINIVRASGGFIIEVRDFPSEIDYSRNTHIDQHYKLHLIADNKDFIEEIGKIITMTILVK
jgi:hypothetical protein